jgi:amidase
LSLRSLLHCNADGQTVLDNALLLQAIAGADGIDDRQLAGCPFPGQVPDYPKLAQAGIKGLKIGIMTEGFTTSMADPRVSELVRKAAKEWEGLGATVGEVSVEMHSIAPEIWAVSG